MAEQITRIGYVELETSNETNLGPLAQAILDAYNNNITFTLELFGLLPDGDNEEVLSIPNRTVVKEGNAYFIDLSDINTTPEGKPKPGIRMIEYYEESSPDLALTSTRGVSDSSQTMKYLTVLMGYANFEVEEGGGEVA